MRFIAPDNHDCCGRGASPRALVGVFVADFEFKLSCWCSLVGTLSLTAVQELAHGPTDIASVRHHPLSL